MEDPMSLLLTNLFADPTAAQKQERETRGINLSNMLAGPNPIARIGGYYLPQQVGRFTANIARAAEPLVGKVDLSTPQQKFMQELSRQGIGLDSAANLTKASEVARKLDLHAQALQLSTMASQAAKLEASQAQSKQSIIGLQNAIIPLLGADKTASIPAIKSISDPKVLTELFTKLSDPKVQNLNTSVQTILDGGVNKLVLVNNDTGATIATIGTAPAQYGGTVQGVNEHGANTTYVLNRNGQIINQFSTAPDSLTANDIYMAGYREEKRNNPNLTYPEFNKIWAASNQGPLPLEREYNLAMQGKQPGDVGYLSFSEWLDRNELTSSEREYNRLRNEGYPGSFYEYLTREDRTTLEREYEFAQAQGFDGSLEQWIRIGGSKSVNLPSVPVGYQLVTNEDDQGNPIYSMKRIDGQPMSALEAGRLALVKTGLEAATYFNDFLFNEDGSINRANLLQFQANQYIPIPGAGRSMDALFLEAIEAKLRLETGAAAPDTEIERLHRRLKPSVFDTTETMKFKQLMLHRFLGQAYGYITGDNEGGFDSQGNFIIPGVTPQTAAQRSKSIVNSIIAELDIYQQEGTKPAELQSLDELKRSVGL